MRLISECLVEENLVIAIIELSSSITIPEVFNLLDNLTKRVLHYKIVDVDLEKSFGVQNSRPVELLFNLAKLEKNPSLANKELYWKCWELVFMWCAMNQILVKNVFELYPTLRMLLTMSITRKVIFIVFYFKIFFRDFKFPPPALDSHSASQILSTDQKQQEEEWNEIKKLDQLDDVVVEVGHQTDAPHPRFCFSSIDGSPRKFPTEVAKNLEKLSQESDFGPIFSAVKSPDLVLKITNEQGPMRTMPSLMKLLNCKPDLISKVPLTGLAQLCLILSCEQNLNKPIEELSSNLHGVRSLTTEASEPVSESC